MADTNYNIKIVENKDGISNDIGNISTKGYLLLYVDGEQIKSTGNMNMSIFSPIIKNFLFERLKK